MTRAEHREEIMHRIGHKASQCSTLMSLEGALPLVEQAIADAAMLHHAAGRKEAADRLLDILASLRELGQAFEDLLRLPA